jgi:hypothetical protein
VVIRNTALAFLVKKEAIGQRELTRGYGLTVGLLNALDVDSKHTLIGGKTKVYEIIRFHQRKRLTHETSNLFRWVIVDRP